MKRIKAELFEEYGVYVGRDALARLLSLWGLKIRRKIKKRKISLIKKILISLSDRANLLLRTNIVKPLQAVSSDISEIVYNNGKSKAYLAVHKDCLGQMVYGWKLDENQEVDIVLHSFNMAIRKIRKLLGYIPRDIIFHQDQGSQFTSYRYVDMVLKNNMILSYSTPGTPTDNPGQESFFGRLKDECQDEFNEAKDFKQLQGIIKRKMNYYNKKRIHTSIQFKSPEKYTINFIKNISLNYHSK